MKIMLNVIDIVSLFGLMTIIIKDIIASSISIIPHRTPVMCLCRIENKFQ